MPKKGKKKEKTAGAAKPEGDQQEEVKDVGFIFSHSLGPPSTCASIWLDRGEACAVWPTRAWYGVRLHSGDHAHKPEDQRCHWQNYWIPRKVTFCNINTVQCRVDKVQIFDKKPPKEDPNATIKNSGTSQGASSGGDSFSQTATASTLSPPKFTEFSDQSTTLFEIFKTYGADNREEAPKTTLFYDFKPYNSTEPVLLALMIKGPDFKKTIWYLPF